VSRFRFRARSARGAASDLYAELEAAAIAAARANNAALWYIGRDLAGVFEDSGGTVPATLGSPVGLWRDRQYGVGSASGYPASQATAANKPTVTALSTGYLGLSLDGINDNLATSSNFIGAPSAAYTLIASAQHASGASASGFRQIISDGRGIRAEDSAFRVLHSGTGRFGSATPGTFSPGATHTVSATYAGGGGNLIMRRNGSVDYSASTPAATVVSSEVFIGQRNNSSEYWRGSIALACACAGVMSGAHRLAIERFAAHLIGVAYVG
jgi:hypothetical protein